MKVQDEARPYDSINVTPMLDLAYVLLVVFILMTTASVQGLSINLPKPSATPPTERHPIHVLRIDPDGSARLDGVPKADALLLQELQSIRAIDAKSSVVIQGDGQARYERVVAMIDLCNEAEVAMSIATGRIGY
ncbi:Biopolymer transporter ExbD [Rubrivivax sp. A210]|uniref:ExbD/TolR family protein n=1 Tax=Rubrivivax sp. A210 TaxID=2772301 RepID=UPI001917F1F9|nr:biopolymer transporter ExbD [Rubrivivax sp. A210]CAD5373522.1 Biopolymer transporter ExbD [Rubrivivax sp. A210]